MCSASEITQHTVLAAGGMSAANAHSLHGTEKDVVMQDPVNPLAPGAPVGITEEIIRELVDAFYMRVRQDEMLAPVFDKAIRDWDSHLDKLCDFWSSVVLMTGRYKGTPMKTHAALSQISAVHFDRWLMIFRVTAIDICPPPAAALFVDRAERIAQSLERGIAVQRGQFLTDRDRLR